jgi:sigma-B regulation protein RsbU (phosphoserine phosphatase)
MRIEKAMSPDASSLLLVDDEELNREGLARRLRGHDYAVTIAKSGREAIELLGEHPFDLVLLDIMMPGMSGLEVLKFLRRVDSLIDLPIIMVTAKGESEDMVEALELGANDYVTKPLDFPVVLARIRTQLALRRAASQVTELEQKLDARNKELEAAAASFAAAAERLAGDRDVAARLQQVSLPFLPREVAGARLAWAFKPCCRLAGDFLNAFRLDDRHLGLCALGAGGHGAAAALLAVTASHLLARLAATQPGPGLVAGQLGKHFAGAALGQSLTFLYGVLGLDTGEFRFTSAGHPGPVRLPRGAPPVQFEVTGPPVGVGTGSCKEQVVTLGPGDRLALFTDGVTGVPNADGEHYGTRRLLATLEQSRRLPLDKSLDALVGAVESWHGDTPRNLDLAILLAERTDPAAAAAGPGQPLPGNKVP